MMTATTLSIDILCIIFVLYRLSPLHHFGKCIWHVLCVDIYLVLPLCISVFFFLFFLLLLLCFNSFLSLCYFYSPKRTLYVFVSCSPVCDAETLSLEKEKANGNEKEKQVQKSTRWNNTKKQTQTKLWSFGYYHIYSISHNTTIRENDNKNQKCRKKRKKTKHKKTKKNQKKPTKNRKIKLFGVATNNNICQY
jgi:hypothetical protein